jgi:integrase
MPDKKRKPISSVKQLDALKPEAERYFVPDAVVPGLSWCVMPTGKKGAYLIKRMPGAAGTRHLIGKYGEHTLAELRDEARGWLDLIQKGKNPTVERERARQAELRKQKNTFASVAEEYLKKRVSKKRTAHAMTREIRRELIDVWGERPITDITRADGKALIEAIADRPAPYMAHLIGAYAKTLFGWAVDQDYIEVSPFDRIKLAQIAGEKKPRQRSLKDTEIAACWRATERLGYPFGPLYQLLWLTGTRLREAAGARRGEFDKTLWTIPPARFKSDVSHLVPLTEQARAVIDALPQFEGDCLFSTTWGAKPVSGFSKAKARLDALMKEELGEVEDWRIHDIRRTVRTKLASLRVPDTIAEMVLGHGKRGLQRVYDVHHYEPEMREALELWANKLRDIVTPPHANVVSLKARA